MNKHILWSLTLACACGGDPLVREELYTPCVQTVSWSESLDLHIAGPPPDRSDSYVVGINVDGEWGGGIDPDGTSGIDTEADYMELAVQAFFESGLGAVLRLNEFHLEVSYAGDAEGRCDEVAVALDDDALLSATETYEAWRTEGVLGDRPIQLLLRDVVTEVIFHDIGVRLVLDEGGVTEVVIGGWMSVDEIYEAVLASLDENEVEDYDDYVRDVLESAVDLEVNGERGVSFAFEATF